MRTTPTWGRVTARPHEHLVHLRNGRVVSHVQGGSAWLWPGDTVALIDTAVHRLRFVADQVTREKTGVSVAGLAVFRVVQPLVAYRMLDLDQPGAIDAILEEMFTGATRRLVANLTLEECLTRRKDALAAELMAEIAPVVSGRGAPEDDAAAGWGIAIDTIEIQDVRVLSAEVFERLQAPYREGLALEALAAEAEVARERARLSHETAQAEEARRRELMGLEEARLTAERAREERATAHAASIASAQQAAALQRSEEKAESAVRQAKLAADARRETGAAEAEVERMRREAQGTVTEAWLQEVLLTRTLPALAEALAPEAERMVVVSGEGNGLTRGVAELAAVLQAFGIGLPGRGQASVVPK
jgi:hypothetical protein